MNNVTPIGTNEAWFNRMTEDMQREGFTVTFQAVTESVPLPNSEGIPGRETLRIGHSWHECHVCHESDTEIPEGAQGPGIVIIMDDAERAVHELTEYRRRFK